MTAPTESASLDAAKTNDLDPTIDHGEESRIGTVADDTQPPQKAEQPKSLFGCATFLFHRLDKVIRLGRL
ncbi:hypothetical protein [Brevundimonas sp. UBA4553]|uniref:hypothetical protein n=1 Tax=Brevundimonas sp. UBA4553 TaxID=1946127 RepID=UPI0025C307FC|nr:hypothetical protein [Brevundimonas sp. UBA4553]